MSNNKKVEDSKDLEYLKSPLGSRKESVELSKKMPKEESKEESKEGFEGAVKKSSKNLESNQKESSKESSKDSSKDSSNDSSNDLTPNSKKMQFKKEEILNTHKENSTKRNEPKKRNKQSSIFLLLGVFGLIALLIYLVSISGMLRDDSIAKINGEKILFEDFKLAYSQLPIYLQTEENKGLLLSQMINRTLVLQEASKKGIKVSEEEINQVLQNDYKSNFENEQDYKNALLMAKVTENDLLELINYQLFEQKLVNTLFPEVLVDRVEVEEFFEQNKQSIAGFYEAYFGIKVESIDDIYEEIEEVVILNKTIHLFSEYMEDLLEKSDIIINRKLLDRIQVYEDNQNDSFQDLDLNQFVIPSEEIDNQNEIKTDEEKDSQNLSEDNQYDEEQLLEDENGIQGMDII